MSSARTIPTAVELEEIAKAARYNFADFARLCGYSGNGWQFRRAFRRYYACTPRAWLNEARIKDARSRLLSGERPKEIIGDLGFVDLSHLCHAFKRVDGHSPSEFLRNA